MDVDTLGLATRGMVEGCDNAVELAAKPIIERCFHSRQEGSARSLGPCSPVLLLLQILDA